jgi:hypothetical protein
MEDVNKLSIISYTHKTAFDRVRSADVMECLREREVPEQTVIIIKELTPIQKQE